VLETVTFNARSVHTMVPDRIYRVELRGGSLYFLRVGGQFDLDRERIIVPEHVPAVFLLAVGEALFRKRKQEELIARDANQDPEELLRIHPHNFKLTPADIRRATFLPKKWFLALFRRHFGCLVLELADGQRLEFHFEQPEDLRTAFEHLGGLLGGLLQREIVWDPEKGRFVRTRKHGAKGSGV
jgi:hypothetical protein